MHEQEVSSGQSPEQREAQVGTEIEAVVAKEKEALSGAPATSEDRPRNLADEHGPFADKLIKDLESGQPAQDVISPAAVGASASSDVDPGVITPVASAPAEDSTRPERQTAGQSEVSDDQKEETKEAAQRLLDAFAIYRNQNTDPAKNTWKDFCALKKRSYIESRTNLQGASEVFKDVQATRNVSKELGTKELEKPTLLTKYFYDLGVRSPDDPRIIETGILDLGETFAEILDAQQEEIAPQPSLTREIPAPAAPASEQSSVTPETAEDEDQIRERFVKESRTALDKKMDDIAAAAKDFGDEKLSLRDIATENLDPDDKTINYTEASQKELDRLHGEITTALMRARLNPGEEWNVAIEDLHELLADEDFQEVQKWYQRQVAVFINEAMLPLVEFEGEQRTFKADVKWLNGWREHFKNDPNLKDMITISDEEWNEWLNEANDNDEPNTHSTQPTPVPDAGPATPDASEGTTRSDRLLGERDENEDAITALAPFAVMRKAIHGTINDTLSTKEMIKYFVDKHQDQIQERKAKDHSFDENAWIMDNLNPRLYEEVPSLIVDTKLSPKDVGWWISEIFNNEISQRIIQNTRDRYAMKISELELNAGDVREIEELKKLEQGWRELGEKITPPSAQTIPTSAVSEPPQAPTSPEPPPVEPTKPETEKTVFINDLITILKASRAGENSYDTARASIAEELVDLLEASGPEEVGKLKDPLVDSVGPEEAKKILSEASVIYKQRKAT